MSLGTRDTTPPLTGIAAGGVDIPAGQSRTIPGTDGRVKLTLCHAEGTGRVWLGIGAAAVARVGLYLNPGDVWDEYDGDAISLLNSGTDTARVTWQPFGVGA